MAGLLTHLGISLFGALMLALLFRTWFYSAGFFIGHLIADLIDFGIVGLKIGSVNPSEIMKDPWFIPLAVLGHTFWHWLVLIGVMFLIVFVLFKTEHISKKSMLIVGGILLAFLVAVGLHIYLDGVIIETSYWI